MSGLHASFSAFFAGCVQLPFLWDIVFLRVLCFLRARPLASKGGSVALGMGVLPAPGDLCSLLSGLSPLP